MGEPAEFQEKIKVSYGLIIWVATMCLSMGYLYASMIHNDRQSEKNAYDNRVYTEQEVGGLRSDWERQNKVEQERYNSLIKKIEDLEKYHKK